MVIWKSVSVSRYQQRHCKTFLSVLRVFLCRKTNVLCPMHLKILSCTCLESLSFYYDYLLLYDFLFIQREASFGVELPFKASMAEFFKSTLASLPRIVSKHFLG